MRERFDRRDFFKVLGLAASTPLLSAFTQKNELPRINCENFVLNEKASSILSKVTPLSFDTEGNLVINNQLGEIEKSVFCIPSRRSKERQSTNDKVKEVKLLVVHFDGAQRFLSSGKARNARNTLYGLDGKLASVNWCVDEFDINPEGNMDVGYGILQTQPASDDPQKPYKGRHVTIGVELATGRPDLNRIYTNDIFTKLGLKSNLSELIDRGIRDIDSYSVGYEQIGWYYSSNFPKNFPPEKQIANALSLTLAAMKQFNLGPWDVVGHQEIQEKPDPGDEFMATLRFLMGVYKIQQKGIDNLSFSEYFAFKKHFNNVGKYLKEKSGKNRYDCWNNYIGFEKFVNSIYYTGNNYRIGGLRR